jgi:hypothetical protein
MGLPGGRWVAESDNLRAIFGFLGTGESGKKNANGCQNRRAATLFGRSPVDEVRRMKTEFALPPAHANAAFVSSH